MPAPSHRTLLLAFFLSGAAALSYEMAWTRQLVSLFGVTYHAITTILVTFMGGLALGSWVAGRLVDRSRVAPLVAFAVLEAVLGVWAQLFTPVLGLVEQGYLAVAQGAELGLAEDTALRFVFGALVLLPPALASGATLPVASRAVVHDAAVMPRTLATLYGANVAGALVGAFATTFFLVGLLGFPATAALGTAANLAAALLALALHRQGRVAVTPPSAVPLPPLDRRAVAIGAVYFAVGASAMSIEILWTRVVSQAGWNAATTIFGLVLVTYLLGHALGAGLLFRHGLAPRLDRGLVPLRAFLVAPALIGALTLGSVLLLAVPTDPFHWQELRWLKGLGLSLPPQRFWLLAPAVLLPAAVSGALFPLASRLTIPVVGRVGGGVGRLAALSTVGGIFGAVCTGFWLMPAVGTVRALILVGTLVGAVGLAGAASLGELSGSRSWSAAGALALLGGLLFALVPSHAHILMSGDETLLAFSEGRNSSTAVVQLNPRERQLLIHGERIETAGGGTDVAMAAAVHPSPETVLVIGFGTGRVTAEALKTPAYRQVTAVDFNGDLLSMAPLVRGEDAVLFEDPRFRFVDNDGRHHLLLTDERYDVIVNDAAIYAWYLELSTREFSELARSRLEPEGLYLGRLHLFRITNHAYQRELQTFLSVFPNAAACMLSDDILMLIGRNGERPIVRPASCSHSTDAWLSRDDLRRYAGGALITDARPLHLPWTFLARETYPTADEHGPDAGGALPLGDGARDPNAPPRPPSTHAVRP